MNNPETLRLQAAVARQRILLANAAAALGCVSWPSQRTKNVLSAIEEELAGAAPDLRCWCESCRPISLGDMRMVLCPTCGDKRCQRAQSHELPCQAGAKTFPQPGAPEVPARMR